MASPPPPPTGTAGRNAKHYIVAGLTAVLAAAVVVTVFFIVLSPARVYFSVTNASSLPREGGGVVLAFTLVANNTSQRAAVRYQSLSAYVSNNTGSDLISWVRAEMNTTDMSTEWHPHGRVATVDATLQLLEGPSTRAFFAGADTPLSVVVAAVARFKVAGIRTRLYDINVRCGPVIFVRRQSRHRSRAAPPLDCSPA